MEKKWIENLMSGKGSNHLNLREHILEIHKRNTGFTENCAQNFKNNAGRSSYEWLAEIISPKYHFQVLDLACGSGPLLEICDQNFGKNISLFGVDMSDEELSLAKQRLKNSEIKLKNSTAQNLNFIADKSVDVVLCHWALTLMDPLEPVLKEVKRILSSKGIFGAIVDGNDNLSPHYKIIHNIIYKWAKKQYSNYGSIELGDPRVRDPLKLQKLIEKIFNKSTVKIEPDILELKARPPKLAKDVSGFFYASLILSKENSDGMLNEVQNFFSNQKKQDGFCTFKMPINRLVIET